MKKIRIIGAGLAGSEAAYQLVKRGYEVEIFEAKRIVKNEVQKLDGFAELVCSNSLRSNDLLNAVGTLKEEMRLLDSLIIKAAEYAQIPVGGSLAVDRQKFSAYVTHFLQTNPLITIVETEFAEFDFDIPTIVASGPLTTNKLQTQLQTLLGTESFYFFDAVAPIITKDSVNMEIVFRKNRYDKGESSDYLNCPMTKEEYETFYNELISGELAISHLAGEKELPYFEGCMPIEALAKRGPQTLLFGPLKPKGLNKTDGTRNYAVVQLRQDNAKDSLYNLVGFQTNLKWPEQKRIFSLIPGLENAQFVRYGVMHKNNFINSPRLLNAGLQLKTHPNFFFAGQITGVEGYVESAATGIVAAINLDRFLNNQKFLVLSDETVLGSLINYILNASPIDFQPMKANWGIVADLESFSKRDGKEMKKQKYSQRAIHQMEKYLADTD